MIGPEEDVVDLFAGGGGASQGIEAALGRPVNIAINHSAVALAVHAANHPETAHLEADIWEVQPKKAVQGRSVGLLWASPDCTHFSSAKGGKPRKQGIRSLAWAVVRWARDVRPKVIMLENVQEFRGWGPLGPDDRPIKAKMGVTFNRWRRDLERLGYVVDYRILDSSHFGAPTRRKRLFLVARCDGEPIRWPTPTHGPGMLPYRTAAECIDWRLPCPSIFERKRPLAEKTMWRIAQGIRRFVLENPKPFIVTIDQQSSKKGETSSLEANLLPEPGRNHVAEVRSFLTTYYGEDGTGGQDLFEAMRTITAKARLGLVTVEGIDYQISDIGLRMLEPHELLKAQFGRFADAYDLSAAASKAAKIRLIGNSVAPEVAEALVRANFPNASKREAA